MSKNYNVLRVGKLKKADLHKASLHNKSLRVANNADPLKTNMNLNMLGSDNLKNDVLSYLHKNDLKVRNKTSIVALEFVISASSDFFKTNDVKQWAEHQLKFLQEKYDDKVVSAVLHLDEATPHMHLIVVPNVNEKLNCKAFQNGQSKRGYIQWLEDLQTDHARHNQIFNLARGEKKANTLAEHKTIKAFHSDLNKNKYTYREHLENITSLIKEEKFNYHHDNKIFPISVDKHNDIVASELQKQKRIIYKIIISYMQKYFKNLVSAEASSKELSAIKKQLKSEKTKLNVLSTSLNNYKKIITYLTKYHNLSYSELLKKADNAIEIEKKEAFKKIEEQTIESKAPLDIEVGEKREKALKNNNNKM